MAPMLARPFHRPGGIYEEKYDGWRMLAFKDAGRVRLVSRKGVDHTARFPRLAHVVAKLRAPRLILDGEVCVFDDKLVSQFHLLAEPNGTVCRPPVFRVFDVLAARGVDTRGLPLHRRRAILEDEVAAARWIYPARRLADDGHKTLLLLLSRLPPRAAPGLRAAGRGCAPTAVSGRRSARPSSPRSLSA